jgi:sialidase-1
MASLISGPEEGQLLFSNPDSQTNRDHMTIKMSLDGGKTWPYSLLLDEFSSWGYSCLSMIDEDTVGILYESSTSQILFQAVKLSDIMSK